MTGWATARHWVARRVARTSLARLPWTVRTVVLACWVATLVVAAAYLLVPRSRPPETPLNAFELGLAVVAGAVLAGTFVFWASLRDHASRPRVLAALAAASFVPVATAVLSGSTARAVAAAVLVLGAGVVAVVRRRPGIGRAGVLALLTAAVWVGASWPRPGRTAAARAVDVALTSALLSLTAILVIQSFAVAGIVGVVEGRHARTTGRLRRDLALPWAYGVVGLSVVVVVLRLTVLKGLFGATDESLWSLRSWSSWPLATLVGALFFVLVVRSTRSPLARDGRAGLFVLLLMLALGLELATGTALVAVVVAQLAGRSLGPGARDTVTQGAFLATQLAGLAGLVVLLVRPRWRRALAGATALVALVYLVPALVGQLDPGLPTFWSTCTQVVVVLVGLSVVGLVWRTLSATGPAPWILVRLAVVPLVAVHAFTLLPAFLGEPVVRWAAVIGVAGALLLGLPLVAADQRRRAADLSRAAAVALLGLLLAFVIAATGAPGTELASTLGLLYLAVPTSFALCCAVRRRA